MNIQLDDGYQFGLGAFETIGVKNGAPCLLEYHLERLERALAFLGICQEITEETVRENIRRECERNPELFLAPAVMKLMVSEKNVRCTFRKNPYTREVKERGFALDYSGILRNETSPFVYHKTMNYGDNILEKRRTHDLAIDDVVFLNTRGELTEGSTNNIFFVKGGNVVTPPVSAGLLPGVVRRYVLEHFDGAEQVIRPEDVDAMEECFVTNSLMGVMPVTKLGEKRFAIGPVTRRIMEQTEDI